MRYDEVFRRDMVGSRQKLVHIQKYLWPLCKHSIIDIKEILLTKLKVPEWH